MILDSLNITFNNREIALITYLALFIIWTLTQKNIRKSIVNVIRALFAWKILISILMLMLYVAVIIYCLALIKLWDKKLIKDAIYWTFGVGFILMMNSDKAIKEDKYFKNLIKDNFKLLLILEFIVGLYVFGIITEFILMPFVIYFSMLLGYTEVNEEHKQVHNFFQIVFSLLGFVYLIFSGYNICLDFKDFTSIDNLKTFIFPIAMTLSFMPFTYFYALVMHYESLFVRLGFSLKKNNNLRRYAKWRILLSVNFSLFRLKRMTPGFLFGGCTTKEEILKEINTKLKSGG